MTTNSIRLSAAVFFCFAAFAPSTAQYAMSPVTFPSSFNVNAMTQIGKSYNRYDARPNVGNPALIAPRPESFFFRSSATNRRANLARFVKKSRMVDPAGAAQMEQMFASMDVIEAMRAPLSAYGFRIDNVADAYAAYWMNAWAAAHGDTSESSRTTAQAVKAQSARALAAAPEFQSANDATKQEFAEALLVQAAMISATVDTYKNDPNMMRQIGAAVRKGAKASGLDLDAMTLTDEGFVPARKTGAADTDPTAPDAQLASAAPTTNDHNPPYLLMAAAGGAGTGGVFMLGKMMRRRG
jgi:hypothetical protein